MRQIFLEEKIRKEFVGIETNEIEQIEISIILAPERTEHTEDKTIKFRGLDIKVCNLGDLEKISKGFRIRELRLMKIISSNKKEKRIDAAHPEDGYWSTDISRI